jgi:hypothetical protein
MGTPASYRSKLQSPQQDVAWLCEKGDVARSIVGPLTLKIAGVGRRQMPKGVIGNLFFKASNTFQHPYA